MKECRFLNHASLFAYGYCNTTHGYINEKAILAVQGKQPFLNLDKTNYSECFLAKNYFNLKKEDQVNDYYYEVYLEGRTDPFFVTAETFEHILENI